MNTKTLAVAVTLAAGLAAAGAAQAAGKMYVGAKLSLVDFDAPGFDNAFNVGAYGGYNLLGRDAHWNADLAGGTLAVEAEVSLTAIKGDAGPAGDWDLTSVGAFAAYRHPLTDAFYLKGKLGVVRYEVDLDVPTPLVAGYTGRETALAAGIGAGWQVGPGRLEAEVATYEGDVLLVGVGFHMNF